MGAKKYPKEIGKIAEILRDKYHDFDHYNLKDPLDELIFIILSTKTEEKGYRNSFRAFQEAFLSHDKIGSASDISRVIAKGGLSNSKAKAIRSILDSIIERFDSSTLDSLRSKSDKEAEAFLLSLPGVGKKIARCVLMYSLDRKVFPVDTHCWRISRRLGWVRPTQKDRHCSPRDMDRLQTKIPPDLRFSLHVNMVSLGREICVAGSPKCASCPILKWCKKIGVHPKVV